MISGPANLNFLSGMHLKSFKKINFLLNINFLDVFYLDSLLLSQDPRADDFWSNWERWAYFLISTVKKRVYLNFSPLQCIQFNTL